MKDLNKLMGEYKNLEREQYVTQEPMSLDQVESLPEVEQLGAVFMNEEMKDMQNPNLGEAKRLEDMMSQLEDQGMEPQYIQELGAERDAMQAQQDIDDLPFKEAFNQHYEKHKELPAEERPKLKWKGREYLAHKADEPSRKPADKKEDNYNKILGKRESSNNYKAVNQLGYLGKYQFGGMALQDLGYKDKTGKWTGKDGIKSKEDFLNSPDIQEKAMSKWKPLQDRYLKSRGADKYIGKSIGGIIITKEGLRAAAHLVGDGAVAKMLKSGKIPKDANGVKATEYLKLFEK